MRLINCTPHKIVIQRPDGSRLEVEPEGTVARVKNSPGGLDSGLSEALGVPVQHPDIPGRVEGLPPCEMGVRYLVSAVVGAAVKRGGDRFDVLVPGTGPADGAIRNERGHIVAVTCLKRP